MAIIRRSADEFGRLLVAPHRRNLINCSKHSHSAVVSTRSVWASAYAELTSSMYSFRILVISRASEKNPAIPVETVQGSIFIGYLQMTVVDCWYSNHSIVILYEKNLKGRLRAVEMRGSFQDLVTVN